MPFDALVAVTRQSALSRVIENHGLKPVPKEALAAHKAAQQRKFGPSVWYRHQTSLSIALVVASPLVGAIAGSTGGFTAHSGVLAITGSFVWMCLVALVTGTGMIRLRAGSYWEERELTVDLLHDEVPAPIARIARTLHDEVPAARLILGELKRQEVVLDPYLLVEVDGETACLGIWENDTVIACAE